MMLLDETKRVVRRCISCKHAGYGYLNVWQNRDAFYLDCLELARVPSGDCPLYEQEVLP